MDKLDPALSRLCPQGSASFRKILSVLAVAVCQPASAQTPFPSFAYVVGIDRGVDLAGQGKMVGKDGLPDIWIAFIHRSLAASLPHGGSGYYIKSMKLYHPTLANYRWDTVPGSTAPILVVTREHGSEILNHRDGSIDGLKLSREGRLDLFVSDPSFRLAGGLSGLMLEIVTTDGTIRIPVEPSSFYEHLD
jgi:hypothetical protein